MPKIGLFDSAFSAIGLFDNNLFDDALITPTGGGTTVALAGTSTGVASVSGVLSVSQHLAGTSAGAAVASGSLTVSQKLAGSSSGVGSGAAALTIAQTLTGSSQGASSASGVLTTFQALSGGSAGVGTSSGTLTLSQQLIGSSLGIGSSSGVLTVSESLVSLRGGSLGTTAVSGRLTLFSNLTDPPSEIIADMNKQCPNRVVCPGSDNPLGNFSSEAPDLISFRALAYPIFNPNNPIGGHGGDPPIYFADGCDSICVSTVSQEEADLCAARAAFVCSHGDGASLFYSNAALCSVNCGGGSVFFWTVPAGAFVNTSQDAADQQAQAYACEQAGLNAFCLNDIEPEADFGADYSSTVFTTGPARQPVHFTVVQGALPDGLSLAPDTASSALITGKPTANGPFTFTIQATDARGVYVQKQYTITVSGCVPWGNMTWTNVTGDIPEISWSAAGGSAHLQGSAADGDDPSLELLGQVSYNGPACTATLTFRVQLTSNDETQAFGYCFVDGADSLNLWQPFAGFAMNIGVWPFGGMDYGPGTYVFQIPIPDTGGQVDLLQVYFAMQLDALNVGFNVQVIGDITFQ